MISAKIILNLTRRLLVAGGAALAVVACGLRINRPEDQMALDQAIDPRLMERTPQLVIDMRSIDDAVASLNGHFSLKTERWTSAGPSEGPQWHPPGERMSEGAARLRDATQASAVARILRRFSYADNELGYCIKEGVLRIGPESMEEEAVLRIYDMRDWRGDGAAEVLYNDSYSGFPLQGPGDFDGHWIQFLIRPTLWAEFGGNPNTAVSNWGNFLLVRAPLSIHREFQRMAHLIKHPIGPGMAKGAVHQ